MSVFALGLNHNTAPLDLRGRFAFSLDQVAPTLQAFRQRLTAVPGAPEVALLSTCNRTELYCAAEPALVQPAVDWLAGFGGVAPHQLMDHAYVLQGGAAARHAFRVASGLDSMVLGEPQILGQMKQAVREADTAGTLGTTLHQMFQRSFAVAKDERSSTEIGSHSISMAAASVRLASQLFERAVGHGHAAGLAGGEVRGHQLDHLAGADEQHAGLAQVLEQLGGQAHRGGGHADGVRADLGGRAHVLRDREGPLEHLVQRGAERAGRVGLAHGLLHLAEDLRLAQHHRIEPTGYAKGMAGSLPVFKDVCMVRELVAAHAAHLRQPVHRGHHHLGRRGAVELGAVARGDEGGLGTHVQSLAQGVQRRAQLPERERKTTAQIDGRGRVVQAEGEDAHGAIIKFGVASST